MHIKGLSDAGRGQSHLLLPKSMGKGDFVKKWIAFLVTCVLMLGMTACDRTAGQSSALDFSSVLPQESHSSASSPSEQPRENDSSLSSENTAEESRIESETDSSGLESHEIVDNLDFLTQEQQDLYQKALMISSILSDNASALGSSFGFNPLSHDPSNIVKGNYLLYADDYAYFSDWMHSMFTDEFLQKTDYPIKFINYNGKLAVNHSMYHDPVEGFCRRVEDDYPDTYRRGTQTDDTVEFTLISHYDHNCYQDDPIDVFTIEYPIRFILTDSGWRLDEFHNTVYG